MRELLNLQVVRMVAAVTGAIAGICLAVAVAVLVPTVSGQQDRLAHQSLELECRGEVAADSDVLRNDVALWLSRGLRAVVRDDEEGVNRAVAELERLDNEINQASDERERTIAICQDGERSQG